MSKKKRTLNNSAQILDHKINLCKLECYVVACVQLIFKFRDLHENCRVPKSDFHRKKNAAKPDKSPKHKGLTLSAAEFIITI